MEIRVQVHELGTITAISPGITEPSQGIETLLALPGRATWELKLQLHLKLPSIYTLPSAGLLGSPPAAARATSTIQRLRYLTDFALLCLALLCFTYILPTLPHFVSPASPFGGFASWRSLLPSRPNIWSRLVSLLFALWLRTNSKGISAQRNATQQLSEHMLL